MSGKVFPLGLSVFLCSMLSVSSFTGQTKRPVAGGTDFKVTYRTSVGSAGGAAQNSESTTMIKGPRERSEQHMGPGYEMITITQCDLKRTLQISDSSKKFIITPMETSDSSATPNTTPTPSAGPTRQGGIVTYTTSIMDTGERKEMYGFTARHVKQSTTIQSSANACSPVNQRMEVDGWYIDLNVGFDCQLNRPTTTGRMPARGGCQDQTRFRREGTGKTGFPLIETMKMTGENGQIVFSTTKEVIELSRQPLDSALFDIPPGYTQAMDQQELFGIPSMADAMSGRTDSSSSASSSVSSSGSRTKQPGAVRIGVAALNNKAGKPVSLDSLRAKLMGQLESAGLDPVALNGSSQMEADAEAKAKQCDFILLTDLTALKSSKIGGMFGRVTGVDTGAKTEAKVEFKLFAVGESSPRLQSSASAKEEGEEASAGTALESEAKMVITEARKKGRG